MEIDPGGRWQVSVTSCRCRVCWSFLGFCLVMLRHKPSKSTLANRFGASSLALCSQMRSAPPVSDASLMLIVLFCDLFFYSRPATLYFTNSSKLIADSLPLSLLHGLFQEITGVVEHRAGAGPYCIPAAY